MKKLKKTFEELLEKFETRKDFFAQRIAIWKERGRKSFYKKGNALFVELEKEAEALRPVFADIGSTVEKASVIKRVKRFKKNYKQLRELTKPYWRQWLEALIIAGFFALLLRNFVFGLYHVPTGSAEPTILVGDRVWGNKLAYYFDEIKRGDLVIFDEPRFKYNRQNSFQRIWQKYVGFPIPLLGLSQGPINVVKRVIAVPGDWIEGRVEEGKTVIYLNGERLEEDYVNPYPLIWLNKKRGLLPKRLLGFIPTPPLLQEKSIPSGVWYTYVPNKSFEEQPYYSMKKSEVMRVPGYPYLSLPYTPSYKGKDEEIADEFGPMRVPKNKYWVMGDSRKNSQDSRWFGFLDRELIHGRLSFIIYSVDSQEPFWLIELLKHPIDFWKKSVRWNRFFKKPKPITQEEQK